MVPESENVVVVADAWETGVVVVVVVDDVVVETPCRAPVGPHNEDPTAVATAMAMEPKRCFVVRC